MYYINIFFVYSILGFLIESLFCSFLPLKSGILYGPWTIVYGIGMTFVYLVYDKLLYKYKSVKKFVLLFIISTVFLQLFEGIGGIFLEKVFGIVYWNYENQLLNIGKYMSITMALLWGVSSVVSFYIIRDFLDKFIKKIPKYITWIIIIIFFIDCFLTLWFKSKLVSFFKIFF